jgi:hypothetical protein
LPLEQRDRIRTHTLEHLELSRVFQRCSALVADSPLQRALASAVLWLAKPPSPTRIFPTAHEADAWAHAQVIPKKQAAAC